MGRREHSDTSLNTVSSEDSDNGITQDGPIRIAVIRYAWKTSHEAKKQGACLAGWLGLRDLKHEGEACG